MSTEVDDGPVLCDHGEDEQTCADCHNTLCRSCFTRTVAEEGDLECQTCLVTFDLTYNQERGDK